MRTDTFKAVLLSGHKDNAAEVPFDPRARWSVAARLLWPGRRGFLVHATLNGKPFASAIVTRSRKFWLLVPEKVSVSAKVAVGQSGEFSTVPDPSFELEAQDAATETKRQTAP